MKDHVKMNWFYVGWEGEFHKYLLDINYESHPVINTSSSKKSKMLLLSLQELTNT
jgi:hypothetical protein